MKLLVLSPHRDDAAFSLSLSMKHWLNVGHGVTVMNIFTRSRYAPYSEADLVEDNDRLEYVSAMRRKEDQSFLRRLPGLKMSDLNLKDAPIRLRCSSDAVCALAPADSDPAIPKIQRAVAAQLQVPQAHDAIVVPLALGHHVDHCVVRDAVHSLALQLPRAFYEDLPYAAREGSCQELSSFRKNLNRTLTPVFVRGDSGDPAAYKLKLATLYASQIDQSMAESIAHFSDRYQGAERLWADDEWLRLAAANQLSTKQQDSEAIPLP